MKFYIRLFFHWVALGILLKIFFEQHFSILYYIPVLGMFISLAIYFRLNILCKKVSDCEGANEEKIIHYVQNLSYVLIILSAMRSLI